MTISDLRTYAAQGVPIMRISEMTGLPYSTIHGKAAHAGIKFAHYTVSWKQKIAAEYERPTDEIIMQFLEEGYSERLTAGALGIDRKTLHRYCQKKGFKFTGEHEACKPGRSKREKNGRKSI